MSGAGDDGRERLAGFNAVAAALAHDPQRVRRLRADAARNDARMRALLAAAARAGVAVTRCARAELDRLSGGARHQGVVADYAAAGAATLSENDLEPLLAAAPLPLLLILDGVQDPHNLGACLRSAAAAAADAVVVPADGAVGLTPTVRKVASGGAEAVPLVQVGNLARCLRRLQKLGIWLIGTAGDAGQSLYSTDLSGPCALLLGGEARGLRPLTRKHCDRLVAIPMADGPVDSLNVSVAAGIALFEAVRQRRG